MTNDATAATGKMARTKQDLQLTLNRWEDEDGSYVVTQELTCRLFHLIQREGNLFSRYVCFAAAK